MLYISKQTNISYERLEKMSIREIKEIFSVLDDIEKEAAINNSIGNNI
jgi:hypothetical protein